MECLFKLFMGDIGLLCAACMENIQFDILNGNLEINMGSILENAMAQELHSNGFELFYYDSSKIGEVDFVIQKGSEIQNEHKKPTIFPQKSCSKNSVRCDMYCYDMYHKPSWRKYPPQCKQELSSRF